MGMPAARLGDKIMQWAPHCHLPIHPPAPTPTPVPHPPMMLNIMPPCAPTVLINNKPAARITDMSQPCSMPCMAVPGFIAKGSVTVSIQSLPAARVNDATLHPACVAPIPSPTGRIMPPCATTVLIGG